MEQICKAIIDKMDLFIDRSGLPYEEGRKIVLEFMKSEEFYQALEEYHLYIYGDERGDMLDNIMEDDIDLL